MGTERTGTGIELSVVVVVNIPSFQLLPRALAEPMAKVEDVIVVSYGQGGLNLGKGLEADTVIRQLGTEEEAVFAGSKAAKGEFVLVLRACEWAVPKGHHTVPRIQALAQNGLSMDNRVIFASPPTGLPDEDALTNLKTVIRDSPPELNSILHVIPWVEDEAAEKCRAYTVECRTIRASTARELIAQRKLSFGLRGFYDGGESRFAIVPPGVVVPEVIILHQPTAATYLECGDAEGAMRLAAGDSAKFARQTFIRARAECDRRKAMDAFKVLFEHYSLHEELWRLRQLMSFLPYDLEESPEMDSYRALLHRQIGHLETPGGETAWYSDGSPYEVADDSYANGAHLNGVPTRYLWLIEECRKHGLKKVVEFGSVDGISLFPLIQLAPDIEWHGVEVSKPAVEHGREVAKRNGLEKRFYLHHATSFTAFTAQNPGGFDGVFIFEVLEHNRMEEDERIIRSANRVVRPEGRVFITTPEGNWSAHDEKTRDLELRKDHINAFTVNRMRKFLESIACPLNLEVFSVESKDWWDANSNIHASYSVGYR